jgi:hypothetical protein
VACGSLSRYPLYDSLPIPSREEIQAASPVDSSVNQPMLGASSGLVHGGTATETASGQLSNAQMMEDPSEAFEREIQGGSLQNR